MLKKYLFALIAAISLTSCTRSKGELGTESNPVKLFFVPSVDARLLEDNSKKFKAYLEQNTPYKFVVSIPQSYVAVVEAFGTQRADLAALNTFGYALANKKFGVQARLTFLRFGSPTYQAQFIARNDGKINKLEDINGKKMAFVDPASTSGYIIPMKTFKDKKIIPKETVFAMKHDSVITMIYQGQVDAGATYYSPPENGEIQDARRLVKTQYPDVEEKIKIVALSRPVPNDPIAFRKDLPEEMKMKIASALKAYIKTEEGKEAFKTIYGATELKDSTDADYSETLKIFDELGINIGELAEGKKK